MFVPPPPEILLIVKGYNRIWHVQQNLNDLVGSQKKLSISKGNKQTRAILYNGFINLNKIYTEKTTTRQIKTQ